MREDASLLPDLEPLIQEEFLDSLHTKIATVESLLESNEASVEDSTQPTQGIILILRLLQFELGFRSAWTPKTKDFCDAICKLLFKLALVCNSTLATSASNQILQVYGTSNSLDPVTYPLIIDTLYYLYDGEFHYDVSDTVSPFHRDSF